MQIMDNIINIMKIKGITAYKIEQNTGIKQQTFHNWKKGTIPPADKLLEIIKYLGVTPNEVFGYEQEDLNENEKEILHLVRKLSEREQIKLIGKLEEQTSKSVPTESSNSMIG